MAILIASPDLVRVFCRTPRQMLLANALCRAWERQGPSAGATQVAPYWSHPRIIEPRIIQSSQPARPLQLPTWLLIHATIDLHQLLEPAVPAGGFSVIHRSQMAPRRLESPHIICGPTRSRTMYCDIHSVMSLQSCAVPAGAGAAASHCRQPNRTDASCAVSA